MRLGSLEAGGTKMVMGIMDESMKILRSFSCPTRVPDETMKDVLSFFEGEELDAFGIAAFGPVDLHPDSPTYGSWHGAIFRCLKQCRKRFMSPAPSTPTSTRPRWPKYAWAPRQVFKIVCT